MLDGDPQVPDLDDEPDPADPRAAMAARGWEVVYKPHETMAAYNAFYNVAYEGQRVAPPAARRMGVPLGEVWLTEYPRPYERYILCHEYNEIRYRAHGYGVEAAHELAVEADEVWAGDPAWEELWREINLVAPERVTALPGVGETLFERIRTTGPTATWRSCVPSRELGHGDTSACARRSGRSTVTCERPSADAGPSAAPRDRLQAAEPVVARPRQVDATV